jgi:hypothetical protein
MAQAPTILDLYWGDPASNLNRDTDYAANSFRGITRSL